jgi:tRNA modification GTPase
LGARLAQPGEFSRRAFLNGKMDLIQAEAIADLIDSASEEAARSAQRSLQGDFSHRIQTLREKLVDLRAYLEAAIDFPEEEIDHLSDGFVDARLAEILESSIGIVASAKQGSILREGITVVIAGAPNVGKSSLLNCLAESDRAIVTHIPGTTRDLLREHLQIDGLPMNVVDTAGLRVTLDTIEQEGIQRAWGAIGSADVILLVIDDRIGFGPEEEAILTALPPKLPLLVVRNKIDLSNAAAGVSETSCWVEIYLSAKTREGIGFLKEQMKKIVGFQSAGEGTFMARRRHLEALGKVQEYLQSARRQLACRAAELVAEDLRQAQNALGEITGEFTTEDLLDRIFASFCIGK